MLDECLIGKIIQCHIDYSDPESFVVGRLAYYDSDWFLMQDLSSAGRWNGLALYMQSDIVSVSEFSDYIQRIVSLINYHQPFQKLHENIYLQKFFDGCVKWECDIPNA